MFDFTIDTNGADFPTIQYCNEFVSGAEFGLGDDMPTIPNALFPSINSCRDLTEPELAELAEQNEKPKLVLFDAAEIRETLAAIFDVNNMQQLLLPQKALDRFGVQEFLDTTRIYIVQDYMEKITGMLWSFWSSARFPTNLPSSTPNELAQLSGLHYDSRVKWYWKKPESIRAVINASDTSRCMCILARSRTSLTGVSYEMLKAGQEQPGQPVADSCNGTSLKGLIVTIGPWQGYYCQTSEFGHDGIPCLKENASWDQTVVLDWRRP